MDILVVTQYFWPEEFRINDLCLELIKSGHNVTVLTAEPNYPSGTIFPDYKNNPDKYLNLEGIEILRVPILPRGTSGISLALNYFSFVVSGALLGALKIKGRKFDLIFVCQLSPVTAVLPALFINKFRKLPLVMWSLDLWPDSVRAVGKGKSDFLYLVLSKLVTYIYRHCDLIFGQSEEYLNCICELDRGDSKKVVLPNWAEDVFVRHSHLVASLPLKSKPFTIMFAGNLGEAQDFESLVQACRILAERDVSVVFSIVGDGSKLEWLKQQVEVLRLTQMFVFQGRHPVSAMPKFYQEADAALLMLKSNKIFEVTVPGKLQSYMRFGLPIIAMINGAAANIVARAACGVTCNASDYQALADKIQFMAKIDKHELFKMGQCAIDYSEKHFSKMNVVKMLNLELEQLVSENK